MRIINDFKYYLKFHSLNISEEIKIYLNNKIIKNI
jgi:hypothetical protein